MKDFFISYNSADQAWAEWIAWVLEENGYTVVIQAWDFRPGGNFILDMQRATDESKRTIMVLSQDYLKAQYTQPEWAAAFKQDPTSQERRLIPIRVQPCKPTGMLSPLVYVDLVDKPETEAEQLVLDALKDRAKPDMRPSYPGVTRGAERVTVKKVDFPGPKPLRVRWQLVVDGELSNTFDDTEVIGKIVEQLKQLTEDPGLTCEKFESGSIVLTLKGTEEGYKLIESLFSSGQLLEICGLRVEHVSLSPTSYQSSSPQLQQFIAQTSVSQKSPMSLPKTLTALERLKLIQKISALPVGQFEELVAALNPPPGVVPEQAAGQSSRAAQLLKWVEGPTGRGLDELEEVYAAIAGHP